MRIPLVALVVVAGCASEPQTALRPNVVLIMTDDQGWGDLGFHGNDLLRTPHLDALAGQSARCTTFYVSPVCAPTRASLMTGRWNYRTRVTDTFRGRAMMDPNEITLAELLGAAGYATGIFGKWHLGDCHPMRPQDQGFDEVLVHRGGGIGQPSDPPEGRRKYTDAVLFSNGRKTPTRGYCTDVYFDAASEWIRARHDAQEPFLAYIATNAPHGPFHDVPEQLYADYKRRDPSNDRRARIFSMITNIDDNVGKLLATLDAIGAAENTIVVFLVDNGPNGRRFVGGMRGIKGSVYEGGVRSPFFFRWPGRVRPGHETSVPSAHVDVLPTLAAACGAALPADRKIDGRNLLPLLCGERDDLPSRPIVIQAHRGDVPERYHHFLVRTDRWKLVRASGFGRERAPPGAAFELFDMLQDPLEVRDLASDRPETVARLKRIYDEWLQDVSTGRAEPWRPPPIVIGSEHEPITVLTRQDWRLPPRSRGRRSIGSWHVRIARERDYDFEVRLVKACSRKSSLWLRVGLKEHRAPIAAGAVSGRLRVRLPAGPVRLSAGLNDGGTVRGAFQVRVR